jgi:ATP synthase protein I
LAADRQPDLDELEARLAEAKARHTPEPRAIAGRAMAGGLRYGVEIVVATVVGFGIGWFLDRALGTTPWLAILFLMLGVAAGFRNLLRAVNRETAAVEAEEAAKSREEG